MGQSGESLIKGLFARLCSGSNTRKKEPGLEREVALTAPAYGNEGWECENQG